MRTSLAFPLAAPLSPWRRADRRRRATSNASSARAGGVASSSASSRCSRRRRPPRRAARPWSAPGRTASSCARRTGSSTSSCAATRSSTRAGSPTARTRGNDTFVFRRVRPIVEGTLFENIDFRIMPDFANSTLTLFDAYVNFKYVPQAQLRSASSSRRSGSSGSSRRPRLMFIERALPDAARPEPRPRRACCTASSAEGLVHLPGRRLQRRARRRHAGRRHRRRQGRGRRASSSIPFRPLEQRVARRPRARRRGELGRHRRAVARPRSARRRLHELLHLPRRRAGPPAIPAVAGEAIACAGRRRPTGTRARSACSAEYVSSEQEMHRAGGRPHERPHATRPGRSRSATCSPARTPPTRG